MLGWLLLHYLSLFAEALRLHITDLSFTVILPDLWTFLLLINLHQVTDGVAFVCNALVVGLLDLLLVAHDLFAGARVLILHL